MYFDKLLLKLEPSGVGCHTGNKFMGDLAYAGNVILAQTKSAAMQFVIMISK